MGLFRKRQTYRFVSEDALAKNLASQTEMSPQTVAELHRIGVSPCALLRLEYFFYADEKANGEALAAALLAKGYSSECCPAADGSGLFCITGWTTPIAVHDDVVVKWTAEMCQLGFTHDAEFDGWGTTPGQSDPS
jgi:regulator of RNase E activity RraB